MELQTFIDETPEYTKELKKHKLYVRTYSQLNLCIVKSYHNNIYDYDTYPWIKYCRGVVIDTLTNQIVCIPPQKGFQKNTIQELIDEYDEDYEYSPLIDGTMVNMFYHNDEWMIATRSNIGAKNSWDGKQSFLTMFLDVNGDEWFSTLNKSYCYSFLLHHVKNRNVTPITENSLFLVENHERKDGFLVKHPVQEIENVYPVLPLSKEMLIAYQQDLFFSIKGFTLKTNGKRINWINPAFEYVKGLKMNHNDKYLNYISLRQKNLLIEYLKYFPEERFTFNEYRDEFNLIKFKLYERYVSKFIRKEIEMKDIEYPLKPLVYELHNHYKESGEKINTKVVSDYMHQLDGKKIMFIRNHLKVGI